MAYGICDECGCTDERACTGGCGWVDASHSLCTRCSVKRNLKHAEVLKSRLHMPLVGAGELWDAVHAAVRLLQSPVRVGGIYRAQLGPDDWSYVLVVAQQSDHFVCARVSLLLDETGALIVPAAHITEISVRPEEFTDES